MNLSPQTRALKGVLALGISMGLTFATSGCATGPDSNPRDPFEKVNRATYKVNDTIDKVVATPIAQAGDVGQVAPMPLQEARIHAIDAQDDDLARGVGAAAGSQGQYREQENFTPREIHAMTGVPSIQAGAAMPNR